jgi:GrpB-like predicted nucleotidyltransferase (UPF0157 family)
MRKVEVVPHNPNWRIQFKVESQLVTVALGETVVAVHHIGSTAIPGIDAKPIIDLLVEVKDITQVDGRRSAMESLGYEVMGEYGIPGRRFFRKDNPEGVRTHHVHIFNAGSAQVLRHLAFRDYLRAHADDAQHYSDLKRRLAAAYPTNIASYRDGKAGLIEELDHKAAAWCARQNRPSMPPQL